MFPRCDVGGGRSPHVSLRHSGESRNPFLLFFTRHPREGGDPVSLSFSSRVTPTRRSSLLVSVRLPGGRVTFFACTKKVTKEMHPRLRAGGEAAGSLRSAGVWRQGSCPVAKCGPSWPAPRAVHAAFSSRPSPLHRGTRERRARTGRWFPAFAGTTSLFASLARRFQRASRMHAIRLSRSRERPPKGAGEGRF